LTVPPPPRRLLLVASSLAPLLLAGCAKPTGVAYLEIENDQGLGGGGRAEPVYVDPRVEVERNEYRRSYVNNGSNIRQSIRIKGPVMIVPATASATQPAPPAPPAR
jgi:hypothetical protein